MARDAHGRSSRPAAAGVRHRLDRPPPPRRRRHGHRPGPEDRRIAARPDAGSVRPVDRPVRVRDRSGARSMKRPLLLLPAGVLAALGAFAVAYWLQTSPARALLREPR